MQDMPSTSTSIGYGPQPDPCRPKHDCESPDRGLNIIRINIPAGAVINFLNIIEVCFPSGICLIVKIPILCGSLRSSLSSIMDSIKQAGGSVEVAN